MTQVPKAKFWIVQERGDGALEVRLASWFCYCGSIGHVRQRGAERCLLSQLQARVDRAWAMLDAAKSQILERRKNEGEKTGSQVRAGRPRQG